MSDYSEVATATAEEPRVLDTYALVYAFLLLFLVPGAIAIRELPFRTYTFSYVSLITMPFVFALALTFLTDSKDGIKRTLLRFAVLTPIIVLTGVAVLFTSSLALVPINSFLGPEYRAITTPLAGLLLVVLASPLVTAFVRRVRAHVDLRSALQAIALVLAVALVGVVVYLSVWSVGTLGVISEEARKDVVIYIIGGLVWYGPAFGISAGVWRRMGLV